MKFYLKYLLPIFLSNILFACSEESSEHYEIDRNYIKFSHKGLDVPFKTKDIINADGDDGKTLLLFDQNLYMQDISLTTTFEVLKDEPIIISTGKTFGYIKISEEQIFLYKETYNRTTVELSEQFELSSFLQQGIFYEIGFKKTNNGITFFIKGGLIAFEKSYGIDENVLQNTMRGMPFFEVESGSIRVHKSILSASYHSYPKVNVFGDSFIEGVALYQNGLSLNSRWCIKLANEVGVEDCFLDGVGSERVSKGWLDRVKLENSWFKSEYVILSIGTNNYNSIGDYKKYMKQAIDHIKENGQTPILVTVTPRSTFNYDSTTKLINEWVKNSGEKFIDIHKAVTKEDDVFQWKDGYVLSDGVHPTIAGYDAMYEQVKKDCPFLFQ